MIKWPGGKTREWPHIAPFLPPGIRHFVDPFVGGGAPYGLTPFSGRAFLNDRHERLIELYGLVQRGDAELAGELRGLSDDWERLGAAVAAVTPAFRASVLARRSGGTPSGPPAAEVLAPVLEDAPYHRRVCAGREILDYVAHSVNDKAQRVVHLERRHRLTFTPAALDDHAETAVRAGYYTLVRATEHAGSGAAAVADFVFVRDYCYGSMFRTNRDGRFNIPYGGTSYNHKSFAQRVAHLTAPETAASLARARFSRGDFEPFLDGLRDDLGPDDFVFLDPPYHSDFSTYGTNAFPFAHHERLAAVLARLRARWMQVIKATPEVRALYTDDAMKSRGVRIAHEFGKRYGYNVRGRNDRSARHLVITNYDPPAPAGS